VSQVFIKKTDIITTKVSNEDFCLVQGTSIYFVFCGHGLNTQPYLNLETEKLKTDPLVW